jgi:ligand-binding SRPBCC domain-containing protein
MPGADGRFPFQVLCALGSNFHNPAVSGVSRTLGRMLTADVTPPPRLQLLHCETIVPASLDETFAFFADAGNLQRLTPPWLHFVILTTMPVVMRADAEIEYRVRFRGVPLPWRSIIDVWEPGVCFVDRQTIGPYRWWRHEHRFAPAPGGTRVIDHVEYAPRAEWLSTVFVRRDLDRIFAYRQQALRGLLT